jgi:hypothetical protein
MKVSNRFKIALAFVILAAVFVAGSVSSASAKMCKEGAVHYVPGVLSKDKALAQRSALESWRRTYPKVIISDVLAQSKNLKCQEANNGMGWRCFVKASACTVL